ncbi:MAG: hypothetical protein RSC07_00495, partial [Mucinivorans sp.]
PLFAESPRAWSTDGEEGVLCEENIQPSKVNKFLLYFILWLLELLLLPLLETNGRIPLTIFLAGLFLFCTI